MSIGEGGHVRVRGEGEGFCLYSAAELVITLALCCVWPSLSVKRLLQVQRTYRPSNGGFALQGHKIDAITDSLGLG